MRLPLLVVAAVAVAEAAVLLLRPRDGLIRPEPVSARSYFSAAQIDRARDFRRPQLALYAVTVAIEAGVLILLVRRPPRWMPRRLLLAGATVSLAVGLAPLPVQAVMRQRSLDVGLATQSWGGWAGDIAKSSAIGAVLAGLGAGLAGLLARRFGRWWWAPGSAVVVATGAAFLYAGPVLLDPVFNKFTPLPAGQTRSDVLALAREAGVKVGQVYEVDASRRTTAANAYVTGLGPTKRVVLYDTLLKDFTPSETRLVVAHELGHVHYRDVPHGLLYVLLVAPLGVLAVTRLADAWAGDDRRRWVPALALAVGVVSIPVTTVSNQLSRRIEARADAFALRLTHETEPFVGFQRRIAVRNIADPDPPEWLTALLATHPTTVQRIGIAKAYEDEVSSAPRRTPGGS
jgi:STE24 endopeptidase